MQLASSRPMDLLPVAATGALALVVSLVAGPVAADGPAASVRDEVEADWQRQDECRLMQIRRPGLVRFMETELPWPGVKADDRLRVPKGPAPKLDGHLDDACWKKAVRAVPRGEGQPAFLLGHDGRQVYIGVSMPTAAEAAFQGPSTALDAGGAVDGVKDGKYAFHTDREPNPWWQVDLGSRQPIEKIVVYNRLDYAPGLHNADKLLILTSDDEKSWTLRYDNRGKHFGGATSGKPLTVDFTALSREGKGSEVQARFVRLQVRSDAPIWFHLDEVEIYAPADPEKNIALRRPARQSSLSQWSRGGNAGGALFTLGTTKIRLEGGEETAVVADGIPLPAERAQIGRDGGQTCIEIAFPWAAIAGGFPAAFAPPQGTSVELAAGGPWQITWAAEPQLGFGKNRLLLELRAEGPLDPPLELKVESVVFTPARPVRQVVFQKTLTAAGPLPIEFQVAEEGAAAVLVSARQAGTDFQDGRCYFIAPVEETLRRARRLAADFDLPQPQALAELGRRAEALSAREKTTGTDPAARADLYREARWAARRIAYQNPRLDFDRLVLVKRFTQQAYPDVCLNHMPWVSRPGGDICILSLAGPEAPCEVRNVLDGALGPGHVHGMDLWWDADRVVFGYAKAKSDEPPAGWLDRTTSYELRRTEEPTHLFEIGLDGRGLRQLTDGEWSDLDPTYLANGDIAFVSERCGCSLQCNEYDKDETSCNIYVMRADGSNIRRLSVTKDGDYLPHALDDGTIAYTRWEYQERGWAHIQSIWTVRPDGTGADTLFKQHLNEPWALEDMRSIPECRKLVAVATGHHTLAAGPVVIIDPRRGMNSSRSIRIVTPGVVPPEGGMSGTPVAEGGVLGRGGYYMTPWPLSGRHFLVSYAYCNGASGGLGTEVDPAGYALYLIDVYGTKELIYRDPEISCFIPIPMKPRKRPPVCPDVTDPAVPYATCSATNVGYGVEGVRPESIRYIRISQRLQWPYCNTYGGQRYEPDVKRVMINWTPARVIGTVPVESDGSAHFQVPIDTPVYFQLLDENQMELRRMRSFISFQPGEVRGCVGCHETREEAARAPKGPFPLAMARDPSIPVPPPWGNAPISFLRDVQPVFDAHCVACHGGMKPAAGLDFSGGLTTRYNRAYDTIFERGLVSRSNVGDDAKITQPLAFGSHKSKLVHVLRDGACSQRAELDSEDWLRLVTWIDANAPYHDAFINKRPEVMPYDLPGDRELAAGIAAVHARRCAGCHQPGDVSRADWIDLRRPQQSLFLAAPLAKEADGLGRCEQAVYKSRNDPDYRAVLEIVEAAARTAWERPRRDLRALRGNNRFGVFVPD